MNKGTVAKAAQSAPEPSARTWHAMSANAVVEEFKVDPQTGLNAAEVDRRREKYGPNELTARRGMQEWKRFLLQFHQPLVYILLAAVLVTALLEEWVDAGVIFAVVFINSIIGFLQESKAEKAIDALRQMVVTEATVRRDGQKLRVPSGQLVPGDVVLLDSGDKVPADLRLLHLRNLQIDESALTGESVPVEKHARLLEEETSLADRRNLAFGSTLVTAGQGEGVVFATGDTTETGRIATMIHQAVVIETPLTRKIAHFSKILLYFIIGVAGMTFAIGIARGGSWGDMFMASVAIAVGAIPEGLPAAVTITLAIGVSRMARHRAIIRKLPAVETLGSTTVICSDKTGTLTQNQMTVQEVFAGGHLYQVSGAGYQTEGGVHLDGQPAAVGDNVALVECLGAGLLCNDSQLVREGEAVSVQGDPTEAALIVAAEKAGLSSTELGRQLPRIESIPFSSESKFMATLHGNEERKIIYLKGAAETIVDKCTHVMDSAGALKPVNPPEILALADRMAAHGLRVLAFARRELPGSHAGLEEGDVAEGLTLLGLQGKMDPPRPEAIEAVRKCQSAGIQVKMITGDHLLTAKSIAAKIGLRGQDADGEIVAMTGQELSRLSDAELNDVADHTTVFARVAPEQKLRLVKALQARGHVVAMTGDGVNDAPALKQADIGIAMGVTGTEVAKTASDMLLTDDNFASIEAAVEEGRGVYDNLSKFIVWTLPSNGGEAGVLLAAIILGTALPALPVQLLWINMSTAILLGLPLVFEPKESNLMLRPPRDPKQPILDFPLFMRTGLVTLITLAGAFALFLWEQAHGATLEQARTIVVNTVVVVKIFYLFNCRHLARTHYNSGFLANPWIIPGIALMMLAQLLITYVPLLNTLFHTAPISLESWLRIGAVGLIAFFAVGFEKWVRFKTKASPPAP